MQTRRISLVFIIALFRIVPLTCSLFVLSKKEHEVLEEAFTYARKNSSWGSCKRNEIWAWRHSDLCLSVRTHRMRFAWTYKAIIHISHTGPNWAKYETGDMAIPHITKMGAKWAKRGKGNMVIVQIDHMRRLSAQRGSANMHCRIKLKWVPQG